MRHTHHFLNDSVESRTRLSPEESKAVMDSFDRQWDMDDRATVGDLAEVLGVEVSDVAQRLVALRFHREQVRLDQVEAERVMLEQRRLKAEVEAAEGKAAEQRAKTRKAEAEARQAEHKSRVKSHIFRPVAQPLQAAPTPIYKRRRPKEIGKESELAGAICLFILSIAGGFFSPMSYAGFLVIGLGVFGGIVAGLSLAEIHVRGYWSSFFSSIVGGIIGSTCAGKILDFIGVVALGGYFLGLGCAMISAIVGALIGAAINRFRSL